MITAKIKFGFLLYCLLMRFLIFSLVFWMLRIVFNVFSMMFAKMSLLFCQSIFPTFITQVLADGGFLSCQLYFVVFSWLSYLLPKTALEILRKYKRRKGEDSAGRVYFHCFCTSVFPNSNLTSSQRPILHERC